MDLAQVHGRGAQQHNTTTEGANCRLEMKLKYMVLFWASTFVGSFFFYVYISDCKGVYFFGNRKVVHLEFQVSKMASNDCWKSLF